MEDYSKYGSKAKTLADLQHSGFSVPDFVVFSEREIESLTPSAVETKLRDLNTDYFAVRSSCNLEDGDNHSFAGQFETELFVSGKDVFEKIKTLAKAKYNERVKSYAQTHQIDTSLIELSIIVQEMIPSDVSGVGFSKNPLKPYKNEKIVNAVYGLGEGLVSGNLDADDYTLMNDGTWRQNIADKNERLAFQNGKLGYAANEDSQIRQPALNPAQLNEVAKILSALEAHYGSPQDIEFCYSAGTFYLLQSRPITNLKTYQKHIIWDNSNIVESYPGITLPFTFSFILKIYESVYYNFSYILGVPKKQLTANKEVFEEMLGHIKGRVYYHLIHWYKALAMLPAYQINAQFMEKMMGVSEPLGTHFTLKNQPGKLGAYKNLLVTLLRLLRINYTLPEKKKQFTEKVTGVIKEYKAKDYAAQSPKEIWADYKSFKNILVKEWVSPLANDLLAMIYFGTLEKLCGKWLNDASLHTDLVSGRFPLKSVEPSRLMNEIIQTAEKENLFSQLKSKSEEEIWSLCKNAEFGETGKLILTYIEKYGDRSVGELKLENETFTQNPLSFITILKSYQKSHQSKTTEKYDLQKAARKLPLHKRVIFKYVAKKAAETVADRENLRFLRTFGFGTVRTFMFEIARQWKAAGYIDEVHDIFYLTETETNNFIEGELNLQKLRDIIQNRKKEFKDYEQIEQLPERIHQVDDELDLDEEITPDEGQLFGIPCCAGEVTGRVRVLSKPDEVKSLDGDILVTTSTDPGWITIFQSASAILVERGSTLSHAAIVSREMGIPCIVAVKGITRLLKTGDKISMNGKTGIIELK